jgi:hypothetical protein
LVQSRSQKTADTRDQLEALLERVEIEITSNPLDTAAIRQGWKKPFPEERVFRVFSVSRILLAASLC